MDDLTELLNPVSAEHPCGVKLDLGDADYLKLSNSMDVPDKTASVWRDIESQSIALLKKSKDLQVVLYLMRALIHTEGLVGLHAGLKLLQQFLEIFWENLHPELDVEDDEPAFRRAVIINELNDFERVKTPIRSVMALVVSKQFGSFTLRDIEIATGQCKVPDGVKPHDVATIQAAFDDDSAAVQAHLKLLDDSLQAIRSIKSAFPDANVEGITEQLKYIQQTCLSFAPELEQAESEQADPAGTTALPSQTKPRPSSGAIESRDDVLNHLDKICAYYKQKEPSSPVPLLLERAKLLVKADFNEIVQNLLPEAVRQLEALKGSSSTY